jgi:hypothetical protein
VSLGQLTQRHFVESRAERGSKPVFDIKLHAHERVVGVCHSWTQDESGRQTVDHHVIVWVWVGLKG